MSHYYMALGISEFKNEKLITIIAHSENKETVESRTKSRLSSYKVKEYIIHDITNEDENKTKEIIEWAAKNGINKQDAIRMIVTNLEMLERIILFVGGI